MNFTLMELFGLLGLLGGVVLAFWAFIRWVDGKVSRSEERMDKRVDECHSRINDLRDSTVGREELDRAIKTITDAIRELRGDLKGVNERIDAFFTKWGDRTFKD